MAHSYSRDFLQYAANSSALSARVIVGKLIAACTIKSVLDVGCATGTWLRAWSDAGATDVFGIDGGYVDVGMLQVPPAFFKPMDLNAPFTLGRSFDLVQSLEVAEHIRPDCSDTFVDSITKHANKFVLFSAAPPGQGGEFHINEQPYELWRAKFKERGFVALDAVRPMILNDPLVSYWYRYNTLLYVREEHLSDLPSDLLAAVIPADFSIADVSPLLFRLRKAAVRMLPRSTQHRIAQLKARFLPSGRI